MNSPDLADGLRLLAAETHNDVMDPWPAIHRSLQPERNHSVRVRRFRTRVWLSGVAAVVVVGLGLGVAVLANQAETASAAEALQTLQVEAAANPGPGVCVTENAPAPIAGGVIAIDAGGDPKAPSTVSAADSSQLSDKLALALGVSGDRVRQAMRQTLSPELDAGPPPDPVAGIARQLGVSTEQVCAAFSNAHPVAGMWTSGPSLKVQRGGMAEPAVDSAVLVINGTAINLGTETAEELSGPAEKLGVSPQRLLAAIKAAAPTPPPRPASPPNPDDLINRFAQNLDLSPDKVRAAIIQVEGPNRFYFVLPLPGSGRPS